MQAPVQAVDDGLERQEPVGPSVIAVPIAVIVAIRARARSWRPPIAALCGALAACGGPTINSFNVKPLGYCATTKQIHVDWSTAHGDTTLAIEPSDPTPRSVGAADSMELPPRDMTVTLTVTRGARQVHIPRVVHAVERHTLNGLAVLCDGGWVTTDPAQFGGGANAFDPDAHPAVISNECPVDAPAHATCRRRIQVIHGGTTWDVGPGMPVSVAAANATMSGDWTLKGQLLPDEQCGAAPDAKLLELDIQIGCTGVGNE